MGDLFSWVNDMFNKLDNNQISLHNAELAIKHLDRVDQVLGVMKVEKVDTSDTIQKLIDRRNQARQDNDWDLADSIRVELDGLGILLEDTSEGTIWKKK